LTPVDLIEVLLGVIDQIAKETVALMPKVFLSLIVLSLVIVVIKLLNKLLRRLLGVADPDKLLKKLTGVKLPVSISSLIIILADLGVALIAVYSLTDLLFGPQYMKLVNDALAYAARIVSVVFLTVFVLVVFNALIRRVKVEGGLRSYAYFIVLLLVTAMLVDVTALSEPVKSGLISGLSLGIGISIGVFAVWFFFHNYLDALVRSKASSEAGQKKSGQEKPQQA